MRTDGRTRMSLIVAFRNFAQARNKTANVLQQLLCERAAIQRCTHVVIFNNI